MANGRTIKEDSRLRKAGPEETKEQKAADHKASELAKKLPFSMNLSTYEEEAGNKKYSLYQEAITYLRKDESIKKGIEKLVESAKHKPYGLGYYEAILQLESIYKASKNKTSRFSEYKDVLASGLKEVNETISPYTKIDSVYTTPPSTFRITAV